MASFRDVMAVGEGAKEPRSMRMGFLPSLSIMIFPIVYLAVAFMPYVRSKYRVLCLDAHMPVSLLPVRPLDSV